MQQKLAYGNPNPMQSEITDPADVEKVYRTVVKSLNAKIRKVMEAARAEHLNVQIEAVLTVSNLPKPVEIPPAVLPLPQPGLLSGGVLPATNVDQGSAGQPSNLKIAGHG